MTVEWIQVKLVWFSVVCRYVWISKLCSIHGSVSNCTTHLETTWYASCFFEGHSINSRTAFLIQRSKSQNSDSYVTFQHILPAAYCSVSIVLQVGWNPYSIKFLLAPVEIFGQNAVEHFHRFWT